ncbi:MAG TPA: hypothetical protein VGW74_03025 [Propionibacteriaceae bacterium]|nr:hypothetical protein [Propionibacteriaceae bacterium]
MSAEAPAPVLSGAVSMRRIRDARLVRFLTAVLRQTLAEPVNGGRLRNLDWPYGLLALVVAGYAMYAVAALTVVLSGLIRRESTLIMSGLVTVGLPSGAVWPLVVLLSFGTALFLTAALHGPWWVKILGLLIVLMITGTWSLRSTALTGGSSWLVGAAVTMVGLVILVILRWRRHFAWWELAVSWALVGAAMAVGVGEAREAKRFGFEVTAQLLQQTASLLGYLALPAAIVAGAAVAEVTVRATVAATRNATRLASHRWPLVVLAAVLALRGFQAVREWLGRDPVSQGLVAYVPALAIVAGFAAIGAVVLRLSRRTGSRPVVSELGDELGAVGFAVASALVVVLLPVQVLLAVIQTLASLNPGGAAAQLSLDPVAGLGLLVDPVRVLIGVVLVVLAVRTARRGRPGRALLLGCIGVMLIALARTLVLRDSTAARIDPDVLNLVATAVVLLALVITVVRRRLTGQRALAFAGILSLSALFSSRDFISDPVGFLLGFSGAALVLFGLTWDLLTGSGWGNGNSRRFPRPTRVLLVLTNAVLTMTVLAYAALVRDGSSTIYLDPYAEMGNVILGTALLAAAVIAVFDAAWRNAAVD